MVKICKTICYAAEQLKLMDAANVRFGFVVIYKDVDNVYLTEERIQELYEYNLSNRPAWEKIKDVFVVGCLTGQRVSDYKRINTKMIVTLTDGNKYIKLNRKKPEISFIFLLIIVLRLSLTNITVHFSGRYEF